MVRSAGEIGETHIPPTLATLCSFVVEQRTLPTTSLHAYQDDSLSGYRGPQATEFLIKGLNLEK